jgi:membrane fusion protein (multidrug efflux system)
MKPKSIIIIVAIILALVLVKIFFFKDDNATDAQKPGMQKPQVTNVSGYVVHLQMLENKIFSSGSVMANEEVELRPEVSGKLTAIYFKEGSTVNKGALLAKINDADLQAQLRKLQLQLKLAKEREIRLKGLLDINGVSQDEYDVMLNQTQTIAADIDFTKAQISKTEIRAPFDGKIGLKQKSEGSFVSGLDIIAKIQQTNLLKIDFTIPERYSNIIAIGDIIRFSVDNKSETYAATVFAIEPKIDQQTRNVGIRAKFNNANSTIFPGAFAKIELLASKNDSSIMIPTEAVIPELKGKKVYISKGGKAIAVNVETGIRNDAKIEILSGLKAGDTVIITGIMSLKPDAAVKIFELKK